MHIHVLLLDIFYIYDKFQVKIRSFVPFSRLLLLAEMIQIVQVANTYVPTLLYCIILPRAILFRKIIKWFGELHKILSCIIENAKCVITHKAYDQILAILFRIRIYHQSGKPTSSLLFTFFTSYVRALDGISISFPACTIT